MDVPDMQGPDLNQSCSRELQLQRQEDLHVQTYATQKYHNLWCTRPVKNSTCRELDSP